MGNHVGKDGHVPTGAHLDLFHTPPSSPSEADLAAMALATTSTSTQVQKSTSPSEASGTPAPSNTKVTDWSHKLSVPPEWAVIGLDSIVSPNRTGRAVTCHSNPGSPGQGPPSRGSPHGQSWLERDSGLEPQAGTDRPGEEMALVLLSLMEHYKASLGLSPGLDSTAGAIDLLRRLLMEREELVEEVRSLKDTLGAERAEWRQFQCDLQVAVSVADRLRVEADEAVGTLRESHRDLEGQLAQAVSRQQETDVDLETLRAQHKDACLRLSALNQEHQQSCTELEVLKMALRERDSGRETETRHTDRLSENNAQGLKAQVENMGEDVKKREEVQREINAEVDEEVSLKPENQFPEELPQGEETQLKTQPPASLYLRSLATVKKKEEGCGLREPRRIVMMSERSRSLSRLPVLTDLPTTHNGTLQEATCTTLPLFKKEETAKGRRMDPLLQRQDSWSSCYTRKQDEDQNLDSTRPQDGFSMLLRRHGGSRRNSLLRWCQSRTQGYKNIEITNFSSSWEDGLAFCAVYHTYLPSHISYLSLNPADKKANLCLAFQTGESVGIPATLTVEEMLSAIGPDWQRVLGYVESIFRHFEM